MALVIFALEVSENSRRGGPLEAKSRHSSPGQSRRDRQTAHPQRRHWKHCVCAIWRSGAPAYDHNADRTIWCRDDVVKELLHSLLGGFQKNCLQLFQDTWIFKILEKWS